MELTIGYQLSYREERIWHGTPEVCRTLKDDGLYACLIENPGAQGETLAPGVPDRWFVRGRVPMTKEEIRWLSLCRLGLKSQSVFYDIGSGTGSIAVEAALRSKQLRVYAVEHGEEACGLIAENASRAGVKNLVVVKGEAPECLGKLPVPTHAFIGGSGGRLREILLALREKNPNVRVVLNAVSLETVAEVVALRKELLICDEEITQIAVSRAKKAGSHHLMQAENPIYVISFSLSENGEGEEQKPDRREERLSRGLGDVYKRQSQNYDCGGGKRERQDASLLCADDTFFTGRKKRQCHQVRAGLYRSDVPSDGARRPFPESGHFFHWGETDEKPFCARGRERRPCGDGGRDGTLRRPRWNP